MNNSDEFWGLVEKLGIEAIGTDKYTEMKNTSFGVEILCSIDSDISDLLEENEHMIDNKDGVLIIENSEHREFLIKKIKEISEIQIRESLYEDFLQTLKDGKFPIQVDELAEQIFFQVIKKHQSDYLWDMNNFDEVIKDSSIESLHGIKRMTKIVNEIIKLIRENQDMFEYSGEFIDAYYKDGVKFKSEADNIKIFNAVAEIIRENIQEFV